MRADTRRRRSGGGSLAMRTAVISAVVSALIGSAFLVLALAINTLRGSEARATHALEVLIAASRLERSVIDVVSAERAFIITGDQHLLPTWYQAQAACQRRAAEFASLPIDPEQRTRADQIAAAGQSYIRDYAKPLIAQAERDPASARTVAVTEEGMHRVDALRTRFDRFTAREQQIFIERQQWADTTANHAIAGASAGVAGSIALILLSGGFLTRFVVRPVRQVSELAGQVAGGDLSVRMPETGPAEVGNLERAFNDMTESLHVSRDELSQAADELAESRARIVAAADEARRRIERDLHDGTQQRLVSLALDLRAAESRAPPSHVKQLERIEQGLTAVTEELRDICVGLHPSLLERGGLAPAVQALARRAGVPVELSLAVPGRLPQSLEAAAYYVVSEALTNAAKHACASVVEIDVGVIKDDLRVEIRDDGAGGADVSGGSGLVGLKDRVETVGGRLEITSPPGEGTNLLASIPLSIGA